MARVQLAIVMPAYNEEGCIGLVVDSWCKLLKELGLPPGEGRLIVVNDGSRDRTGKILDEIAMANTYLVPVHKTNGGHGAALIHAYRKAIESGAEWVFHVDSDDQFVTSDFLALWAQRERSDFILGHRKVRHDALHRLVITRVVRVVNFALFGVWIPDANIPYRLIRGQFLAALITALGHEVFAPNIFLSVLAARSGQNLVNVPVHHEERKTGTVSILRMKLIKVCLQSIQELWSFRSRLRSTATTVSQSSRHTNPGIRKAG